MLYSNAFLERVFSYIRLNSLCTNERNRLGVYRVKAELVIRNNSKYICLELFEDVKNKKNMLNAAKIFLNILLITYNLFYTLKLLVAIYSSNIN